jgi:dTDP-4-amino-4,6-dideoxygalactose transaminase
MKIPFLDLRIQYLELQEEVDAAVMRVLDSGRYILGKECESFECAFKEFLVGDAEGSVVAVNSGTDALKLSLLAAGVGPGDEVITVANTAIPTATAICSIGAVPVFCDVDPHTWMIDAELVDQCVTKRTKALIPVHLYGGVCDMKLLMDAAELHGLAVIEDVAQATGSKYFERECGTVGRFGAFSFYPSKNLGAFGDGGAVFVKLSEDRDRLRMLRNYGQSSRYKADVAQGENSRLDELQAAILCVKLNHLERWNLRRQQLSAHFQKRIIEKGLPVQLQQCLQGTSVVKHLFVVKVDPDVRDKIQQKLLECGIQTLVHYPVPLYRQPAFSAYERALNSNTQLLCDSVLSLPFHQYLTENEIDYITDCLSSAIGSTKAY